MRKIAEDALKLLKKSEAEIRRRLTAADGDARIRPESIHKLGEALVLAFPAERVLLIVADYSRKLPALFQGERMELPDGGVALTAPFSRENGAALRRHFPWCAPDVPGEERVIIETDVRQLWRDGSWKSAGRDECFPVVEHSMSDEASFAVFASDCRRPFGVWGAAFSAAEAERLQKDGVTFAVLRCVPDFDAAPGDGSEYAARTFVLDDGIGLTIPPAQAAEIAGSYAKTIALSVEFLRRIRVAAAVSLAGCGRRTTAAELLYLSREWRKNGVSVRALEPEWGAAPEPEMLRNAFAVVRSYGHCRLGGDARVSAALENLGEAVWLRNGN